MFDHQKVRSDTGSHLHGLLVVLTSCKEIKLYIAKCRGITYYNVSGNFNVILMGILFKKNHPHIYVYMLYFCREITLKTTHPVFS